jgi:LDH2 family malate/lactate/ureidoglycolate dehydrogenase
MMPGEREFRTRERRLREGIPLPEETCRLIREAGARVGVGLDL